jgi:hypothetical protein
MADSGNLICVLAGPQAAVDRVKPFTKGVMGRAIIDFGGQEVGKVTLLKAIYKKTFVLNMVESFNPKDMFSQRNQVWVETICDDLLKRCFRVLTPRIPHG